MSLNRQIIFWVATLAVLVIFLLVFRAILLPFVGGMALAYLLDPVADWFQRRGLNRLAATLIILVMSVIVFVAVLVLIVPVLVNQFVLLIANMPAYIDQLEVLIQSLLQSGWAERLGVNPEEVRNSVGTFLTQGTTWISTFVGSVWSGGLAFVNVIALLVVAPVVAFYLLYDWDRMIGLIDSWLPRDHAPTIRKLAGEIDRVISGFVRGQALVSLTLGIFYATSLVILGVNFGFLIGLVAGLVSFIPYLGSVLGFIVSVGIALLQFWPDWIFPVAAAGIFIVGQLLEGYVLQPFFIGTNVGLHPVWLMFALFAFGLLFGFVGLLVAIPAAAAVGVLVRYALAQYLASPIYKGQSAKSDDS
ncbi:AI-2E family transporter [Bauldia sp.]|uniref:AI-2E family transporter n=1 Tax=Bauldia sp. TaxID=2575872 RepID=UPI003BA9545A